MTDLKEGDRVRSVEAMDTLPVGAAVTTNNSPKLTTRHPDGWSNHNNMGNYYPSARFWWDGMELVSLPRVAYSGPMVGDQITTLAQIKALPLGTVLVNAREGWEYTITAQYTEEQMGEERWYRAGHGGYSDASLARIAGQRGSQLVVESLPVDLFETADQFAARFRDLMITGGERAQGTPDHAVKVLTKMGVEFRPTPGMRVTSRFDRDALSALSEKVRIYTGRPDEVDSFAVWEKEADSDTWKRIFGRNTIPPREGVFVVIDAIGDRTEPEEWFTKTPTPEDAELVAKIRAEAWKRGFKMKKDMGWCDEFERVMLRGGVTAESAMLPLPGGVRIGDTVTAALAMDQPVGTMFRAVRDGRTVALFKRDEKSRNKAGTVRVWANEDWKGGNYAPEMVLTSSPLRESEDEGSPPAGALMRVGTLTGQRFDRELAEVPIGTQIRFVGTTYCFEKVESRTGYDWAQRIDGNAEPEPPMYRSNSFSTTYWYMRIGGEA